MSIRIFFDLDEVLANFTAGAASINVQTTDINRKSKLLSDTQKQAKQELWHKIEGTNFYANLPVMDGALEMIIAAQKIGTLCIFSKAPGADNFYSGGAETKKIAEQKIDWVLRHFGEYFTPENIFIVQTGSKEELISPTTNDILIDDRPDNISTWVAAGGTGIHYTSAHDVVMQLEKYNHI